MGFGPGDWGSIWNRQGTRKDRWQVLWAVIWGSGPGGGLCGSFDLLNLDVLAYQMGTVSHTSAKDYYVKIKPDSAGKHGGSCFDPPRGEKRCPRPWSAKLVGLPPLRPTDNQLKTVEVASCDFHG